MRARLRSLLPFLSYLPFVSPLTCFLESLLIFLSFIKEEFSWQDRTERKGLAELLANEKAIGPLLEHLKSTEVGGREAAKEKGLERERTINLAGEELLRD